MCMHDVTRESVAAVTDHFTNAFISENLARVYMTLWRRNDVRKLDADAILFWEIKCKKRPNGLVFKQLPQDPANFNAWKNMCEPYILFFFFCGGGGCSVQTASSVILKWWCQVYIGVCYENANLEYSLWGGGQILSDTLSLWRCLKKNSKIFFFILSADSKYYLFRWKNNNIFLRF